MIVDSQVHIWGPNTRERPWAEGARPHRPQPFGKDDLMREMAAAGVDRVVIVPPSLEGPRNDLALEAARAHPDRFAVMGKIDADPAKSKHLLPAWRAQPGMLGLRFNFKRKLETFTSGRVDWVWSAAESAGIPVYIGVSHAHVPLVARIAERHPGLKLAFDHLALETKARDDEAFRDLDTLLAAAKHPNLAVKVSALPCYSSQRYPYRNLHPYLKRVYDAYGPRRMFWGSDLTRLNGSYRECVTLFTEALAWLTADDLDWIMGRALCAWLEWNGAAARSAGAP
jgi:predicted TIM-barrel fold metal-dependent hydrolase